MLDASSPLLSRKARQAIKANDGFCPPGWNHSHIRENVKFNQIIVSFCGISSASGSTVYSRNVFEYNQLCVGFSFVAVLFKENGKIHVDSALLNDIRPQSGGGAEPWDNLKRRPTDRFELPISFEKTFETGKDTVDVVFKDVTRASTVMAYGTEDLVKKVTRKSKEMETVATTKEMDSDKINNSRQPTDVQEKSIFPQDETRWVIA